MSATTSSLACQRFYFPPAANNGSRGNSGPVASAATALWDTEAALCELRRAAETASALQFHQNNLALRNVMATTTTTVGPSFDGWTAAAGGGAATGSSWENPTAAAASNRYLKQYNNRFWLRAIPEAVSESNTPASTTANSPCVSLTTSPSGKGGAKENNNNGIASSSTALSNDHENNTLYPSAGGRTNNNNGLDQMSLMNMKLSGEGTGFSAHHNFGENNDLNNGNGLAEKEIGDENKENQEEAKECSAEITAPSSKSGNASRSKQHKQFRCHRRMPSYGNIDVLFH